MSRGHPGAAARARQVRAATDRFRRATSAGGAGGAVRLTMNDDDPAGTTGFDRVFAGFGATMAGLTSALSSPEVLRVIRAQFARNFTEEAGRRPWAQLAPSTVEERARLGFGGRHPILVRTGQLRRHVITAPAVTQRTPGGAVLTIRPADSVGGVPKYRVNATGSRSTPARPMVVIDAAGAVKVTSAISRALRTRAQANGLR